MTVKDRFLKYVSYGTNSDEDSAACPSTPGQKILGKVLADDLRAAGAKDVILDENGYVYGTVPASAGCEGLPAVGLIAHMDTSPAVRGDGIKPRTVLYAGGDIMLNESVSLSPDDFPALNGCVGEELIVTDGTTLLGADDKAGAAEIITACEYLLSHPEIKHGRIPVCFTPDEEIGRGADRFDLERFGADWAYTVDGGELGEIEYECFNAASATVTVRGVNIHPGDAKNKMKNAVLLACEFINMLPPAETPAHTEKYEGCYHVGDLNGNESEAVIKIIIRDHDRGVFESRKRFAEETADFLNRKYGEGTFTLALRDSYYNMKEKIEPHMHVIESARAAMKAAGVTPKTVAIRGGTDGARLSYMGLPCPNLSTGGMNFHSVHEYIPTRSMEKMVEVLTNLLTVRQ